MHYSKVGDVQLGQFKPLELKKNAPQFFFYLLGIQPAKGETAAIEHVNLDH